MAVEYEAINNFVNKIYVFISTLMLVAFTIHEVLMKAIISPEKNGLLKIVIREKGF